MLFRKTLHILPESCCAVQLKSFDSLQLVVQEANPAKFGCEYAKIQTNLESVTLFSFLNTEQNVTRTKKNKVFAW